MTVAAILAIGMFAAVCVMLLAGFPVAFPLAGSGLVFAAIAYPFGAFDFSLFAALPSRIFGNAMTNEVLIAVPLFVFMGVTLERSKVAEELLDTLAMLFGNLRGGLGVAVFLVGALMAASTGIVGATVVTMGLLSLPTMLRRGYSPALASGTVCAAGTLGQIIPPSIVLVLLGDQISNAYVDAQRAIGNFSPEPVSVGDLFAGALLPGLLLVAMYILYQLVVAWLSPESSPAIAADEIAASGLARRVMRALVPPLVLIVAVLGSILAGVATPTEAASVGAVGAVLLASLGSQGGGRSVPLAAGALAALIWGLFVGLVRLYLTRMPETGTPVLVEVVRATMRISAMVFVILIGASVFSLVFRGLGGDDLVHRALSALPGGVAGAVIGVMLIMFVLGFFLDFIEIIFVVVPIVAPVLLGMGLNPVWLGVMMAMNLQTSFLTPPFGFALFYLRGVAPKEVTTAQIYRGVLPFVAIQLAVLALLAFYPRLATWLPQVVFG